MEEESGSWVGRARFSHSVLRSRSGREQFVSFAARSSPAKSKPGTKSASYPLEFIPAAPRKRETKLEPLPAESSISKFEDCPRKVQTETACSSLCNDAGNSSGKNLFLRHRKSASDLSKTKQKHRSVSPIPMAVVSDLFKQAKSSSRRFLSPPPSSRTSSTLNTGSARAAHEKSSRRDTGWAALHYFDQGAARVSALEETLEKWELDRTKLFVGHRFASGAYSKLYHGIYDDQPVAVKIIRQPSDDDENEDLATRLEKQFTLEAMILSHLHHPNVVKLIAVCRNPPVFLIMTEYLSGGSLSAFLHKLDHKSLTLDQLIAIALDIARGMEYIHSQGVVHRDLKPENIVFNEDHRAKIVDFGIACEELYCDTLVEDPGTYRWMAPEMIKKKTYGRKVDVYSFGLLLWEMVTGSIPYGDMNPIQAAFAVVDKNLRPAIPSDCPAALQALIEQCWSLQPDKRPEFWQIVEVLQQFDSVLSQDGNLNLLQTPTSQEQRNWLSNWIQKLKHSHGDVPGLHQMPKFS